MMDSQVLQSFSTYATIVILKMMLMSPLTSYFRLTRKVLFSPHSVESSVIHKDKQYERALNLNSSLVCLQVFANLEDTKFVSSAEDKKLVRIDPDVERVRRYKKHLMS